jgi:DNA (cytosine-5)-methyltransferase 1
VAEREIIDLFAGAGGWDEGLARLGHAAFGIDGDPLACSTAEAAGHSRLLADVAEINPPDLAPIWGLIASPPCQAYSTSGKKLGRIDKDQVIACAHELAAGHDSRAERAAECRDARSLLTVEPLRWTVELRPRWIALEQVPPVLELWSLFASLLSVHGYESAVGVLSAERYGVPQTRRRAFLIASLDGPVKLPEPTHRSYSARRAPGRIPEDEVGLLPWVSMAEALGWSGVTATTCTHNQTNHGQRPRGHERSVDRPARTIDSASGSWTIEPLPGDGHDPVAALPPWVEDRPATTVIGSARVAAPTALDRDPDWKPGDPWPSQWKGSVRITAEQAAALQGFRPDYPWQGPRGKQFLQIGNAVCPPIARLVLAEAIRPSLEADQRDEAAE